MVCENLDPHEEYRSRLNRRRSELAIVQQQFIRLGNARLAVAILALFLAWLAFGQLVLAGQWLLVPLVLFLFISIGMQRVVRQRTVATRAMQFYDRGLARLNDRWAGLGSLGGAFRDSQHVYAEDLDVFGRGSLFELLSTARTGTGESTLARWLLAPASCEEAWARQEAVRELCGRLDLREELALLGEDVRAGVHAESLAEWGDAPPVVFSPFMRPLALALSIACTAAFAAFLAHALPITPFMAILACNLLFGFAVRKRAAQIIAGVDIPGQELRLVSQVIGRLEQESFQAAKLQSLRALLNVAGLPASRRIARLERWIDMLDSSDHVLVRIIQPVVLWRVQIVMAIEAWHRDSGPQIRNWLAALGEFEALSSLASLAFERPQWSFPSLVPQGEGQFSADGLRHPLIAPAKSVPNDVEIGGRLRLLIVSGSNMSGKSTLLRAIGLNAVLAWAGAPVAASRLTISPLQLGSSIRLVDSLQEGRSRFMAEITRLRQIVDLTNNGHPVLFLLDELLSGTNSHDRRVGAAAIVTELVKRDAIGLLTTHDLALANLENDLGSKAKNVHFDDQMIDGQMEFDYQLRPGVVDRSNAIELMRAVGLPV